jgi:gliding motility-associated-like protein
MAQTDGTQHTWSPAGLLDDPSSLTPTALAVPADTKFTIVSTIGSCQAQADVDVFVVPYPAVNLGNDTSICYNSFAQLHAAFRGTSFVWKPSNTLSNPNIPNPIATPSFTTTYTIMVFDTIGCPKPGKDTVLVTVRPKVNAFAGRDTAVVIGEPLHLNATGGINYFWAPPFALSATNIPNPIALYDGSIDSVRYKVYVSDEVGCLDSANLLVKIYKTDPQVFVPTAFSPNGDGLNDVFRPIAVGIKKIEYFKVFNRWGQMVFSTTVNGKGWDGSIAGKPQTTNTFVWIVRGIDYLDRPFFRKGTVTLIR